MSEREDKIQTALTKLIESLDRRITRLTETRGRLQAIADHLAASIEKEDKSDT